jgi:hypothetical protein
MSAIQTAPGGDAASIGAEMKRLVRAVAINRDDGALDRLRELARLHPRVAAGAIGTDLPRQARRLFARGLFDLGLEKDTRDAQESLVARMGMLEAELAAGSPSPGLRLAAQAAAYEWGVFWSLMLLTTGKDRLLDEHPRITQRRTAASKRFAFLLKTVEQIRAMERPIIQAVQVNVGTGPASPR